MKIEQKGANKIKYRYNSLEDFLISNPLPVDGQLDDGWGAIFPVKGGGDRRGYVVKIKIIGSKYLVLLDGLIFGMQKKIEKFIERKIINILLLSGA